MDSTGYLPTLQRIRAAGPRPLLRILALGVFFAAGCGRAGGPPSPAPQPRAGAGSAVDLVLLGTTDVHGWLYPHDYYTGRTTDHGLALLKPVIDSVRAANPGRVFLFDSGDLLQGTPLALVHAREATGRVGAEREGATSAPDAGHGSTEGVAGAGAEGPNPVIHAMNLLGYDASAIGNHEYNYGIPHLDRAVASANFPFVSANIFRHGTREPAYRPYVLLPYVAGEGDTILVGVTGNTPPGVHIWDRSNVEGRLEFRDVVASIRPVVAELRARGADLVVVLSHGGLEGTSYDTAATGLPAENEAARLAREVPGIDVIFLGHTHRELADTTINGVLLTQAANWARSVAAATVRLKRIRRGEWTVIAKRSEILRPTPGRADTAFLAALRDAHERTVAYVNSVVGRSPVRWEARTARVEDTPILDFINEVQRRVAGADLSATAAFNLRAAIPEGPIRVADLAGLYIYDNTLRAVRITGAELRAYLEKTAEYYRGWPPAEGSTVTDFEVPGYNFDVVSGVDYVIDLSRPVGERITELRFRGEPVRPDQTFTLALNNYRQGGGGGYTMLANAPVIYDRQEDIRDLLIEEVRRRGTIRPGDYFEANWRLVPAEAAAAALREQTSRELRARGGAPSSPADATGRAGRGDTPLARLLADARRAATGATVAIVAGDELPTGPTSAELTPEAIRAAAGAGNRLVRLHLTGAQLRRAIERFLADDAPGASVSGLVVRYDPTRPDGSRILTVELPSGEPVRDDGLYAVVVAKRLASGPAALPVLATALLREDTGMDDAAALDRFLADRPQVAAAAGDARVRAVVDGVGGW